MIGNKRGQELSTNAIIMIVIGLIVLVVLILGFTLGWNKLLPFFSTNNIETLKTTCSTACATNNQYDYCSVVREVRDGVNNKFPATCNDLATSANYANRNYGIEACSTISC